VRLTGFQPAARGIKGPVVPHQQQQQQQAQQPQQQQQPATKVSAKGPPSSNLTIRLTVQLCSTYEKCSSALGPPQGGVPQPLPRRILTRPAAGVKNNGWDNESCDLILATQVGQGCVHLHANLHVFMYVHARVVSVHLFWQHTDCNQPTHPFRVADGGLHACVSVRACVRAEGMGVCKGRRAPETTCRSRLVIDICTPHWSHSWSHCWSPYWSHFLSHCWSHLVTLLPGCVCLRGQAPAYLSWCAC
jgi:hypothetical protein